ncbi:MAG: hypothetical protein EZS28_048419, partial [Streblomastix strix]
MNGTDQVRDLIRKGDWATSLDLKSAFHHLIVYPSHRPYLAFEAMGKVYQYRAMPFGTQHSPIFFAQALAMVDFGLRKDVHKDYSPKKTGTTLLIKEIYQPNREITLNQDKISSINNRQVEFSKSLSKRSFSLLKANGLSKNESIEEQGMEREYDSTQGNPSRALFVARRDSEKLRDDIRRENLRGSDGIRCIPERLGSDSGITNRRYFSLTWRMEQGTEQVEKQQEGDGSHILRINSLQISLQRAADQSDLHQVRELYGSIRFSKTKSRGNFSNGSEENSQAISTTENTNTGRTEAGKLRQDNRRTKQAKHLGRLFSKE